MSINNREDANKYYQQINKLVDEYMESDKIRPSNLKRYLQPGSERFNKFLSRNNYKEVSGIDQVLADVIEDRVNMERDGVLTFENFKFFESDEFKISSIRQCLYKGVGKADLNMEKALADIFDTNLGSITGDSDRHLFKINDWNGKDVQVVIYSKEDLDVIYLNVIEHLYDEIKKKEVELTSNIKINLGNMIKKSDFDMSMHEYFDTDVWLDLVSDLLKMEFHKDFNNYFIWIKND
jgi:hypothetical protein